MFEGGDGLLEVCVEVVRGVVESEIALRIRTGSGTAQSKLYTLFSAKVLNDSQFVPSVLVFY